MIVKYVTRQIGRHDDNKLYIRNVSSCLVVYFITRHNNKNET